MLSSVKRSLRFIEPTHSKIMRPSNWIIFQGFRVKINNAWNHHIGFCYGHVHRFPEMLPCFLRDLVQKSYSIIPTMVPSNRVPSWSVDYNLTCGNGRKAYLTYFLTCDVIIFAQSFLAGRHQILCIEGCLLTTRPQVARIALERLRRLIQPIFYSCQETNVWEIVRWFCFKGWSL